MSGVTVTVVVPELPAVTVKFVAASWKDFAGTVKFSVPLEEAYTELPEYIAVIVCAPEAVEEKLYVAEPLISPSDGVCVVPSTATVSVPVGVIVLEDDAEATVIVMTSFAPGAGVVVAAESVVFDVTGEVEDPGQSVNKLKKSTEPKPDASSYPVPAA